jgi:hypothetical protein
MSALFYCLACVLLKKVFRAVLSLLKKRDLNFWRKWMSTRDYWMNGRGPGFLAVVWFSSSSAPYSPASANCLSFSVFLWVAGRAYLQESVGGSGWARSQIIRLRESPSGLVQIKYTMTDGVDGSLELISPLLKHPVRYAFPSFYDDTNHALPQIGWADAGKFWTGYSGPRLLWLFHHGEYRIGTEAESKEKNMVYSKGPSVVVDYYNLTLSQGLRI